MDKDTDFLEIKSLREALQGEAERTKTLQDTNDALIAAMVAVEGLRHESGENFKEKALEILSTIIIRQRPGNA